MAVPALESPVKLLYKNLAILNTNKVHQKQSLRPRPLPSYRSYTGAETREGSRRAAAIMQTPTSMPFADVISSLVVLHQEQHQALLDIRTDQERRFQAIIQVQQEDRERFRSWMDREVQAEAATQQTLVPHLPLNTIGAQDDPEAFLDLFDKTAETGGGPESYGRCA